MLINAEHALFGYRGRAVVRVGALELCAGQRIGIFGPNGSGKTTLIRGLTGLLRPISGEVKRARGLRIGYLPQHRAMDLRWPMTGLDAASLAVSASAPLGWVLKSQSEIRRAMAALEVEHLAHRPFAKLSGGQQQRLLLAGALATNPAILLLDEPTDGLDVRSAAMLLDALKQKSEAGLCVVLISHDVQELLELSQSVAWIHPADAEGQPSTVEVITTNQLIDRVTHAQHHRHVGGAR